MNASAVSWATNMWGQLKDAFTPNKAISKKTTLLLVVMWVALAMVFWVFGPSTIIPRPWEVLQSLPKLWEDGLLIHLLSSITTFLEALLLASVISLGLAYLSVLPGFRPVVEVISKGRFLSMVGFNVLFALIIGGGHTLKIGLMVFAVSVFFITSMAAAIARVPQAAWDDAYTLRMSRWRAVWEVVILGQIDEAIESIRQNGAIGLMMLSMVEGIVRAEGGIGVMLLNSNKYFKLEEVYAVQLVAFTVGLLFDYGMGGLKNLVAPWSRLTQARR